MEFRWTYNDETGERRLSVDRLDGLDTIHPTVLGCAAETDDSPVQMDVTISLGDTSAVYRVTGWDDEREVFKLRRVR